jgi:hypothetical protein
MGVLVAFVLISLYRDLLFGVGNPMGVVDEKQGQTRRPCSG